MRGKSRSGSTCTRWASECTRGLARSQPLAPPHPAPAADHRPDRGVRGTSRWHNFLRANAGQGRLNFPQLGQSWRAMSEAEKNQYANVQAQGAPRPQDRVPLPQPEPPALPFDLGDEDFPVAPYRLAPVVEGRQLRMHKSSVALCVCSLSLAPRSFCVEQKLSQPTNFSAP